MRELLVEEAKKKLEALQKKPVHLSDPESWGAIGIEVMGLSSRAYNCLMHAGIDTVGKLMEVSDEELMLVRNLGSKSLDEVRKKKIEMLGAIVAQTGGEESHERMMENDDCDAERPAD